MKAQILKIAGVKTEAEFYKKFPSEEAFMKKHGKELKKAQYGTYVAGLKEQPAQKPIVYDDLYQDTISSITGVSKEERNRQQELAAMKASKAAEAEGASGGGDLAGIMGKLGPMLSGGGGEAGGADISALAGAMAKHGKKLKKAQEGDNVGFFGDTGSTYGSDTSSVDPFTTAVAGAGGGGGASAGGSGFKDVAKKLPGALGSQLGSIIGSIEQIQQNKKDIAKANQWADISQIGAQAATSRPEQSKRRYARPEDNLVTGANPLGKKDSLLAAQNGTEIANTFAPNTIYTDLGYEPLNDSNPKQYAYGGHLRKAQTGATLDSFSGAGSSLGGMLGSKIGGGSGKGGAYASLGSTFGGIGGSFLGPGGKFAGEVVGGLIGGIFDAGDQNKLQEAQDRQTVAVNQATIGKGASNLQQANKAFMENGGYMNPEYNPQVIAKFGDYSMDQLLAPPHDADMLRAGGHLKEYTPPSAAAMYTGRDLPYQMEDGGQMAMGGDLEVHRGEAETMSYNPFLPDGGETIMFRGPSHDNGGMPISYGNNGVEVEGGEPAIKLQDGGSPDGNLVVYGNMVIPEYGVAELGDKNAKGKKFKHYIADLSKVEAKQGKIIEKTTALINNTDANDQFDKLSLNTGQANLIGTTMKLKEIAEKKKTAAAVQNAILDTATEMGLESDALAKGKIKYAKADDPYAKFGAKMETAQNGKSVASFIKELPFAERKQIAKANGIKNFTGTAAQNKKLIDITSQAVDNPSLANQAYAKNDPYNSGLMQQWIPETAPGSYIPNLDKQIGSARSMAKSMLQNVDVKPEINPLPISKIKPLDVNLPSPLTKEFKAPKYESAMTNSEEEKSKFPWDQVLTGVNSVLPFIRPSNQIPLDPSQLSGELYALSQNQEEPVFAQSYQPMLSQGISISLQDQINEITSQARSAERLAQNNPAALAMIASQAAEAKNKVLGEQFRLNQGEAQRVAETNRQTMNEAQKMNIGLFDQQQQRAAQAKSNTKMQNIAALNSINDKILKQKSENRQLGIMENMYNYRFTPNGVAYNMNPLAQFNLAGAGSGRGKIQGLPSDWMSLYDETGEFQGTKKKTKSNDDDKKNGGIVKAIKGL